MRVLILEGAKEVASTGAAFFARRAAVQPRLVLALPTGATAVPFYAELARRHRAGTLDLGQARAFNLDELVLPPGHAASFRAFMEHHAWERIGLQRELCDIPRTDGDLALECRRYDQAIEQAGGLDLAVLGLGVDGHVAYNLPGQTAGGAHVVTLPEAVAQALEVPQNYRPLRALTLGITALLGAKQILLMATGTKKRQAVQALLAGPQSAQWPVTSLRDHPELEVLLDRDAAA